VTPAFNGAGEVQKVERELVFLEPDCVVVFDRVQTSSGTQQIWQLNAPSQPSINGATATVDGAAHDLVVRRLAPASATSTTFSWASDGDFTAGYRLDEAVDGGTQQFLHVLSIDGTVTAATRSDADGQIGAQITFAGGATATVRFGTDGVGGSLVTSGGIDETLSTGVDSLPE